MKEAFLSEICKVNPPKPAGLQSDMLCSFVPMEFVSEVSGSITRSTVRLAEEVEKGYTSFIDGDVIFAKITPCMENGKCAIATNLKNGIGFGSTEFHVLRACQEVLPEWVYFFLRQEKIRKQAASWFHGTAGQQRVPSDFLDQLKLPLPPLPEQQRIAAILQKADRLRSLRRYARQLSDGYLQSVFLEMFGDPAINPKGFPMDLLGNVVRINPGIDRQIPLDSKVSFVPMMQVNEQTGKIISSDEKKFCEVSKGYTPFLENDVLFAKITPCMENGKSAIASRLIIGIGFGSTEFHVLRPTKLTTSEWVFWLIRKKEFRQLASKSFTGTAGQQRVPTSFLENFLVPIPPIGIQDQFVISCKEYDQLLKRSIESERQTDMLFQSLLQRAFQGEL